MGIVMVSRCLTRSHCSRGAAGLPIYAEDPELRRTRTFSDKGKVAAERYLHGPAQCLVPSSTQGLMGMIGVELEYPDFAGGEVPLGSII